MFVVVTTLYHIFEQLPILFGSYHFNTYIFKSFFARNIFKSFTKVSKVFCVLIVFVRIVSPLVRVKQMAVCRLIYPQSVEEINILLFYRFIVAFFRLFSLKFAYNSAATSHLAEVLEHYVRVLGIERDKPVTAEFFEISVSVENENTKLALLDRVALLD